MSDKSSIAEIYYQLTDDQGCKLEKKHLGTYNKECPTLARKKSPFEPRILKAAQNYFHSIGENLTNKSVSIDLYIDDSETEFSSFKVDVVMRPSFDVSQIEPEVTS